MWLDTLKSFLYIAAELTVLFIVISFVISLLQGYIPYEKIEKKLSGKNKGIAAFAAIVFAFITPFCSCSTIPVVVNMLKKKMPFGIVMIFLFASPVLDPTILTLMGVVLGWKVTIIYTVLTTVFSIIIGFTLEAFGFEKYVRNVVMTGYEEKNQQFNVKLALKETFDLMKSVYPYLLIGALIGSVIHGLVPTEWISTVFGKDNWWLIPIAAIIGVPLYIRLSSMIPISKILIAKGMALGPVMAMIISSAGASLPEIILLKSIFKKELVVMFILSVITMSTVSGFIFYLI
ncbi:permease [Pseudoneobacillus rhizosphaerae]|uniref:Two-component membrane permease complex subunit SMU_747c n=1 Tax=Pseudoneobacillus rhizosphaerae TaxID=2880968 RepID=A0A9C7GD96_9BACI|nr:permease [Pseudoneobacillus rhizosphaerae]CAG9610271.1 Putative two-component membrane permease complex subunit SMU_747c [Pseudoneobacillus rhizosphaerae]